MNKPLSEELEKEPNWQRLWNASIAFPIPVTVADRDRSLSYSASLIPRVASPLSRADAAMPGHAKQALNRLFSTLALSSSRFIWLPDYIETRIGKRYRFSVYFKLEAETQSCPNSNPSGASPDS
ncbi:MAG: hypothetical protein J2P48_18975, partial [Alphaproteobacteria bacterium]|nr:hypothetical protein [Alphaproteobacteria bacterium]